MADETPEHAAREELLHSLKVSEARLRGVLYSISDGFYAVDRAWRITEFNPAAEAYFRMKRDTVIGRDLWTFIPNASDQFKGMLRAAMDGAPMAVLEAPSLLRPGRHVELRIAPTEEGLCVALTDITERRQTREQLERAVAERTAELRASQEAHLKAEAELRQAQKLEAVGQLTGGVAHDFNNLLMIISGGLNMLRRSAEPARRDMLMARMQEAVDRGANLTRQLLAFSRRQPLTAEAIEPAQYFAGLNDLLSRSLGVNVRVAIDVAPDVSHVLADPNALQLTILNLAVNARDAMNDKGVVTIRVRDGAPDDAGAPFVSISVIDTGAGIPPDVLEHIFEPFFTTKEIGKGSGLGLAQVHGFAQQSSGRIDIDTSPGQGTRMTLVLPRAKAAAPLAAETAATTEATPRAQGAALLVEDDDEVAAITSDMLEQLGWRVTRVESAEAALRAIDGGTTPDLVFSDVMMPGGKNGIELAHDLRRRDTALRIVLTSGYADSVRREAEQAGLPLLPKPFSLDALADILAAETH